LKLLIASQALLDHQEPYSKSKLELEFNLSEISPVNCKFIRCITPT